MITGTLLARLESVGQDVRYGARLLARAPLFTLVAVLSIAFGLSTGVGIFTVANAFILRPIGNDGGDLYRIFTSSRDGSRFNGTSYADYRDFSQSGAFAGWCAGAAVRANVTFRAASAAREGALVNGGCFELLRLRPHAGRLLAASAVPEAVISYALWNRQFGGDPSVVGKNILLNGLPATIVGIAPLGFNGTSFDHATEFWAPIDRFGPHLLSATALDDRRNRAFTVLARLREGVSPAQAEAELQGIGASLQRQDPVAWTDSRGSARRVTVMKETDARFAQVPGAVPAMLASVMAAIAAIVAIACVNIATMLLARGAARTRELTIRLAVGASRGRLLRQIATESLLIALLGTAIALFTITTGIGLFEANRPEGIPAVNLAVDWHVVAFATAMALFATLMFGLLPAAHVVRLAIAEGMKGRAVAIRSRWMRAGTRETLIVIQVTASVALLVVSALFGQGLAAGASASPGFSTEGVATISVDLGTASGHGNKEAVQRIVDAVRAVANVDTPSVAQIVPLTGSATHFSIGDAASARSIDGNVISPGYLSTVGIPLKRGRDFRDSDSEGRPPVAIASEALARMLWQTTEAAGRRLEVGGKTVEIVGVAGDIRYRSVSAPYPPLLYVPFAQSGRDRVIIHARVRGGGETLAAMEAAARSVDARVIIGSAIPMEQRLGDVRAPERLAGLIGGGVGVAQFGLVLMALWALVAYAVERRTHEIGIRLALGATRAAVLTMLVRPALILIGAGAVLGSLGGFIAANLFKSEFVGLGEISPAAGLPAIVVMTIVAGAAALVPARRATRVDPIVALRTE